ncbi:restriction endonuclease [Candidatus Pacearchaeota archaeon CG10_big_fil_rev_8_21_14_0_10_32_42]|nr:MAG: restriction endonuclease [Candidatus Pacearchaeota archaeon CG10_big_fil_rev_8_21_14_0_10_32_42]
MQVIKSSGVIERFDKKKIYKTIRDAGGSKKLAKEAVNEIRRKFNKNISTRDILLFLIKYLEREPGVSQRYDLKRAIMSLGPSGFPFEKFFARVLEHYGFKTTVGNKLKGKSVYQEVDIIAVNKKKWMIECKYHNESGVITKLHVALYTHARFLDLKSYNFDAAWLVTNTKCSIEAIKYAKGVGLKVTSWKYPNEDNLEKLIEKKGLYPMTILKSISNEVLNKMYDSGFIIAKDLLDYTEYDLSRRIGVDKKIAAKIIEEVKAVCRVSESKKRIRFPFASSSN